MALTGVFSETNIENTANKYLPFLAEIRKRLLFVFSFFLVAWILGFFYYEKIITFTLKLLDLKGVNIVFTSPFQFVNLALGSGLIVGVVVIFPLLILQVFSFLKPALKPNEYKLMVCLLPFGIFLFVFGFFFGSLMIKYVIALVYKKSLELNIGSYLDISKLLSGILVTSALMGFAFQFPIVLTLLLRLGVIKYEAVARKRPFIYCTALVFAALLPPTDILSLFLLTLPLVFLFEITLILNKAIFKTHIK